MVVSAAIVMLDRTGISGWMVAGPLIAAITGTSMSSRLFSSRWPSKIICDQSIAVERPKLEKSISEQNESPAPVMMTTLFSGSQATSAKQ